MINYNNHNITAITYDNHHIKYVYGCGGNLVWSGDTPTPPVSAVGRIKFQQAVVSSDTATTSCVTSFTDISSTAIPGHRDLFEYTIASDTVCDLNGLDSGSVVIRHVQSVSMPPATKHIADYAFYGNLNSKPGAFSGTVISFNEGLETIGYAAFRSMVRDIENLNGALIIPSTVTEIKNQAFDFDGSSWASVPSAYPGFKVMFMGSTPPSMSGIFGTTASQVNSNVTLYVPSGSETAYRNALPAIYSQMPIVGYTVGDSNYNYITNLQNEAVQWQGLVE